MLHIVLKGERSKRFAVVSSFSKLPPTERIEEEPMKDDGYSTYYLHTYSLITHVQISTLSDKCCI